VAALVLSVNQNLDWRAVRDILRRCCDRIDPEGGRYDAQGHSVLLGFGRLNARTAVDLARPRSARKVVIGGTFNLPIPDLRSVTATLEVVEPTPILEASASIEIKHAFIGDLVVTLTPPAATGVGNIRLHDRGGGSANQLKRTYDASTTPRLAALKGKSCQGAWRLRVQDAAEEDEGTLVSFGLELALPGPDSTATSQPVNSPGRRSRTERPQGKSRGETPVPKKLRQGGRRRGTT
jgi:subtilisin-like proprotein convertase family protein